MSPSTPYDYIRSFRACVAFALVLMCANTGHGEEFTIDVKADRVIHTISRHLTGACIEDVNHEIYGGIYSQMIFGESFQEPAPSPTFKEFQTYGGSWDLRDGAFTGQSFRRDARLANGRSRRLYFESAQVFSIR